MGKESDKKGESGDKTEKEQTIAPLVEHPETSNNLPQSSMAGLITGLTKAINASFNYKGLNELADKIQLHYSAYDREFENDYGQYHCFDGYEYEDEYASGEESDELPEVKQQRQEGAFAVLQGLLAQQGSHHISLPVGQQVAQQPFSLVINPVQAPLAPVVIPVQPPAVPVGLALLAQLDRQQDQASTANVVGPAQAPLNAIQHQMEAEVDLGWPP